MSKVFSMYEQVQRALLKAGYKDSKLEAVVFAIVEAQIAAALQRVSMQDDKSANEKLLAEVLAWTKKSGSIVTKEGLWNSFTSS